MSARGAPPSSRCSATLWPSKAEVEKLYDEKGEVAWGYQIRNYVMQPYTLVKDVRTETETAQVLKVLDGEIDDFVTAYLRKKAEKTHKKS